MKRWRRLIGPVLFFLFTASVVVMVGGFLKSKKIPAGAPTALPPKGVPAPAESAVVREAVVPVTEVAVGTIRSRTRVTVAPQVTARIASVLAEAGASVDKEKPLIALDDRELATRLAQAKEALAAAEASGRRADQSRAQAEARLVKGEARRDRVKGLFDKKAATPEQLEDAEAEFVLARAGVADADAAIAAAAATIEQAKQVVNEAGLALGHAKIAAPISGVVVERLVEPGDLAWPGRTLLVLHDPAALRLEARVREGLIGRIRRGAALDIALDALDVTVPGTVADVIPSADPDSRTFEVRVNFESVAGAYPGMFGRLKIPLGTRSVSAIPERSLIRIGQLETVVMKDGARWVRRLVTTGSRIGNSEVEVLSGLVPGDVVGLMRERL